MSEQSAPLPHELEMRITITDRGQTRAVSNVDAFVQEDKQLIERARGILRGFDGKPASMRKHYGEVLAIVTRMAEIRKIFDEFNAARLRYADANLAQMIEFLSKEIEREDADG